VDEDLAQKQYELGQSEDELRKLFEENKRAKNEVTETAQRIQEQQK